MQIRNKNNSIRYIADRSYLSIDKQINVKHNKLTKSRSGANFQKSAGCFSISEPGTAAALVCYADQLAAFSRVC